MFIRTRINPVPGGAKVALREGISGGKREFFPFILLLDVFENLRRSLGLRFACACRCGEPQKAIGTVMGQRRSTLHYPDPPCPQNIASGGSGGAAPRQHAFLDTPWDYASPAPVAVANPKNTIGTVMGQR